MDAWQLAAVNLVLKGGKWASVQLRSVSIAGRGERDRGRKYDSTSDLRETRNFKPCELKLKLLPASVQPKQTCALQINHTLQNTGLLSPTRPSSFLGFTAPGGVGSATELERVERVHPDVSDWEFDGRQSTTVTVSGVYGKTLG